MTNENIVQFRGKATIDRELQLEHDYDIHTTVSVRRVSVTPNDNGTTDTTYVVEPLVTEITSDKGETFRAKRKSKQSVAMRFLIQSWMRDNCPEIEDDDVAYETAMGWILDQLPQILTWLKKKSEE